MSDRLKNKRVLITQCGDYMGPAIAQLFAHEGALIDARPGSVPAADAFAGYVSQNADIDILVANLAHAPCNSPTADIQDADWEGMFDTMVHPLMRLIRHFAPLMAERGHGKIVAITSAAPLRGLPGSAAYCAARGAQNAFIRATGLEFAATNVQINAIAQNYVSNPEYYPDELVASERFQNHLKRNVPIRRIAKAEESAELALFLASNNSDFMVGQVVPFAGGWA
ncbi:SDR family oxidoreductase, partial [Pseudomonadales bacterium]|nr:SDR family oxidoreductase [Pseudomonadales bacterium]